MSKIIAVALFVACLSNVLIAAPNAFGQSTRATRVGRPVSHLHAEQIVAAQGDNREAIAEAAVVPGIWRAYLVWRQRYAHLAICNMIMCHGSCIIYGDGCLVSAHEPVLPLIMGKFKSACTAPVDRSAWMDLKISTPADQSCCQ